jgi:hypothetical protein
METTERRREHGELVLVPTSGVGFRTVARSTTAAPGTPSPGLLASQMSRTVPLYVKGLGPG